MDIKRAKQEIKDSIEAYLAKDEFGEYLIPAIRQRPILLMGAPGIGKTQIMEQIARECKVGLVSYTITHHTRQSAVGLPFIKEKTFGQETFSVRYNVIDKEYKDCRLTQILYKYENLSAENNKLDLEIKGYEQERQQLHLLPALPCPQHFFQHTNLIYP